MAEPTDNTSSPAKPAKAAPKPESQHPTAPVSDAIAFQRKLHACYADIQRVPKNGFNPEHKYNFVTSEDLYDSVRAALDQNRLFLRVTAIGEAKEERVGQKNGLRIILPITYELADVDTGYAVTTVWYGECIEYGDKGYAKCFTSAMKQFIRNLFMVPTGDDPDGASPEVADKTLNQKVDILSAKAIESVTTGAPGAEFRSICQLKGLSPELTLRQAWDKGARDKTAFLSYAADLPALMISDVQKLTISVCSSTLSESDAVDSTQFASWVVGRDLKSIDELTRHEAGAVVNASLKAAEAGSLPTEYTQA